MYTAKIENINGDILELTHAEDRWQVVSITGLNPTPAQINLTPAATLDGALFNSARLDTKQIVILLKINGEVEQNRQTLYDYFRTKEAVKFYYKNEHRDVWIRGYIQTVECDLFVLGEVMQIAMVCPGAYFRSIEATISDISSSHGLFTFPFSINEGEPIPFSTCGEQAIVYNDGADTGAIFSVYFKNAGATLLLEDITTGETFEINHAFEAGDTLTINTNQGEKSVLLTRDGTITNVFGSVVRGSQFFQLKSGTNVFDYVYRSSKQFNRQVTITVSRYTTYRGV